MKTIGLLGGMSWESTAEYYRIANQTVRDRMGGLHSAKILLDSVDFAEIGLMQREDRWGDAADLLATHARGLQDAGAEMVLICTNTMHKVAPEVSAAIDVPLLHIADAAAAAVHTAGLSRVGLLGTAFTMEQPFYRERLAEHGLDVVIPGDRDRELVHRVIFDELAMGIVSDESRASYRRIIEGLVADGAEGIILGCTEIELLVTGEDCPVPVFPTACTSRRRSRQPSRDLQPGSATR